MIRLLNLCIVAVCKCLGRNRVDKGYMWVRKGRAGCKLRVWDAGGMILGLGLGL